MTNEFELADSTRENLIYTKDQLLAGLTEGMVDSPHAIFPGTDEQDYYRGLVTEAAPGTVRQPAVSQGEPAVVDSEPVAAAEGAPAAPAPASSPAASAGSAAKPGQEGQG